MRDAETGRGFAVEHTAQNVEMGVSATGNAEAFIGLVRQRWVTVSASKRLDDDLQ